MMGLILYMFSLVFVSQLASYLIEYVATEDYDELYVEASLIFYGSVMMSMLTLYKCSSGGVDWEEPLRSSTKLEIQC